MDKKVKPGIWITDVLLRECHVGSYKPDRDLQYNFAITALTRSLSKDEKTLVYQLAFDLMKGMLEPPFEFTCAFDVLYERSEDAAMTWDEFGDAYALAHVIPYVREFVTNTTSRMPVPKLAIPPINVFALLEEYNQGRQE